MKRGEGAARDTERRGGEREGEGERGVECSRRYSEFAKMMKRPWVQATQSSAADAPKAAERRDVGGSLWLSVSAPTSEWAATVIYLFAHYLEFAPFKFREAFIRMSLERWSV